MTLLKMFCGWLVGAAGVSPPSAEVSQWNGFCYAGLTKGGRVREIGSDRLQIHYSCFSLVENGVSNIMASHLMVLVNECPIPAEAIGY